MKVIRKVIKPMLIIFILVLLFSTNSSAKAAFTKFIRLETFDGYADGTVLDGDGWTTRKDAAITDPNYYAKIEGQKLVFSQVRTISTTTPRDNRMQVKLNLGELPKSSLIRFEGKIYLENHTQKAEEFFSISGLKGITWQFPFKVSIPANMNQINLSGGGGSITAVQKRWYHIMAEINTISDKYSFYVDGNRILTNCNLTSDIDTTSQIGFILNGNGINIEPGEYWVDDIYVYEPNQVVVPVVESISIDENATDISITPRFDINFNNEMDAATFNSTNITVTDGDGNNVPHDVIKTIGLATESGTYKGCAITFPQPLELSSTYKITVGTGVKDILGQNLSEKVERSFTTISVAIPTSDPAPNPTPGLEMDKTLIIEDLYFIDSMSRKVGFLKESSSLNAKVNINNLSNDTNKYIALVLGVYDEKNQLKFIKYRRKKCDWEGYTSLAIGFVNLPDDIHGYTAKAFVLEESTWAPLTTVREIKEAAANAFFVSPQGDDSKNGTLQEPFKTLERAKSAIRSIKADSGLPEGGITVYLREGEYKIDGSNTFTLDSADSGEPDKPICYTNFPYENPRLIGANKLDTSNASPVTDQTILNRLPEVARDKVYQIDVPNVETYEQVTRTSGYANSGISSAELFFDDTVMIPARWPNEGYEYTGNVLEASKKIPKFYYNDSRPSRWTAANDIWMAGYWQHNWAYEECKIESIDTTTKIIYGAQTVSYDPVKGARYFVYNLLEEIDMPGEWYLDRQTTPTGKLYFYPPSTENLANVQIYLSFKKVPMIKLDNASYIEFNGLSFGKTRDIAITVDNGTKNIIKKCTFSNIGNRAVLINSGTNHTIRDCTIHDIGRGGVFLNGGNRRTLTKAGHVAENNHIYRYSRLSKTYMSAVGINGGVGMIVRNNKIHDAPHLAIQFKGNDHIIEYNEIYDVVKECVDSGAIYSGRDWTFRGNKIRYNYLHDIEIPQEFAGSEDGLLSIGVYLDDLFSSAEVYGNIFNRVNAAVLLGGGRNNIFDNNILIDCKHGFVADSRGEGWSRDKTLEPEGELYKSLIAMPYQDSIWSAKYPNLVNILNDTREAPKYNEFKNNLYVRSGRYLFSGSFCVYAKPGLTGNMHTMYDPGFIDFKNTEKPNFKLKDDAIVFKEGYIPEFQNIPFDKIGLYTD